MSTQLYLARGIVEGRVHTDQDHALVRDRGARPSPGAPRGARRAAAPPDRTGRPLWQAVRHERDGTRSTSTPCAPWTSASWARGASRRPTSAGGVLPIGAGRGPGLHAGGAAAGRAGRLRGDRPRVGDREARAVHLVRRPRRGTQGPRRAGQPPRPAVGDPRRRVPRRRGRRPGPRGRAPHAAADPGPALHGQPHGRDRGAGRLRRGHRGAALRARLEDRAETEASVGSLPT